MLDHSKGLPSGSALLVIDVQQGFDDPFWGRRNNPDAENKIAQLLSAWRQAAMPVIHVAHDSKFENPLHPRRPGNAFKPEVAPRAGELVYRKSVNSAFIGTTLETDLRRAGVTTLVIAGLTTNHCISTTTRMAGNLGFTTYVVSNATATFDRAGLDGRLRPAAEVHASALSDLDGEFATVVDADMVLRALNFEVRQRQLASA